MEIYNPHGNRTIILSYAQHTAVGVYILSGGLTSGILHLFTLYLYYRYHKTLFNPGAIFEIALCLSDLAVAGLHPFSGSAAVANGWFWGPVGCQLYSFAGFIFGTFQLTAVPLIAFDRYIMTSKESLRRHRTMSLYVKIFLINFIHAVVWAALPLVGWSSYSVTPVRISCTIDWTRKDPSYMTYITAYTLFGYIIPLGIGAVLYLSVYRAITKYRVAVDWAPKGHEGKVIMMSLLAVYVGFSGYGFTCIYAIVTDPYGMPAPVHILPPVMAKMTGVFHVFIYVILNPKMLNCIKHFIGCPHDPKLILDEGNSPTKKRATFVSSTEDPIEIQEMEPVPMKA